ncbi:hypothetical protein K4F52_000230 [Lecanicillium sp. MT-2017a]|nr:hypothetical protein K4F52_000230 [Lecanicillium sp. MT-2017a]
MKVIEAQSAVLSNYEVFQHLTDQRDGYKKIKRRGPPNLETVVRELLQYLSTRPSPLSQKPLTYHPACVKELIEKLQPYELSKGEVVMILNLRPATTPALNTVLEDMADRYTDEQQEEMVAIIAEVLGEFRSENGAEVTNGGADEHANDDVAMDDAAEP